MINIETQQFINNNIDADIRKLALQKCVDKNVDLALALAQIKGIQTAKHKMPLWSQTPNILFPISLSLEQCSSQQTAQYKAQILKRLKSSLGYAKTSLVDLTGGFGVDFTIMSREVEQALYVEQNSHLCNIVENNLKAFGCNNTKTICANGIDILKQNNNYDFVFIDPARRDSHGGRVVAIEQCQPNVLQIKNQMLGNASFVVVKLSPMLHWQKALKELNHNSTPCVKEIHFVAVKNECKEIIFVLTNNAPQQPSIYCVNDNNVFICNNVATQQHIKLLDNNFNLLNFVGCCLYEPSAAQMKAGCFDELSKQHKQLIKLDANSHLFISREKIDNWQGRAFEIIAVSSTNKASLKTMLQGIKQANVAVRNFPITAQQLKTKLKLKDGGQTFVFGTTINTNKHIVLVASPV